MQAEYCLLWVHSWLPRSAEWLCLPAEVWAAWAQGLLSVGAVLYSVHVSKRQHELDGVRQRNASRQAEIDRVGAFVKLAREQLDDFDRVGAWVAGRSDLDLTLHNDIHFRGQIINGFNLNAFEPVDARWLLAKLQSSTSSALKYQHRLFEQRNVSGMKEEPQQPLIENFGKSLSQGREQLMDIENWQSRHATSLL